jgi:hypothetical protein
MYLREKKQQHQYTRTSKLGISHEYTRTCTVIIFGCDNCGETFTRLKGDVSPKRLSNNYFHCCTSCDAKRFAQQKGVERRLIWDLPVSSTADISRL